MTLSRYIASAPAEVLGLHCLELSHSDWPQVQRRVAQPDDWEVTLETAAVVTFPGWNTPGDEENTTGQWRAAWPDIDDSGIVTRALEMEDVDKHLMRLIDSVRDSDEPIVYVYRFYTSDDLSAPKIVHQYEAADIQYESGTVGINVRTLDMGNMRWPRARHTDANTPGWRGRW